MAALGDFAQCTDNVGLKAIIHGEVGVVPVPQHPQANKIFPLAVNLLSGVFAALLTEGLHVQLHASLDRKSTRLNSSHVAISYAVFCLKKKKDSKMRVHDGDTAK